MNAKRLVACWMFMPCTALLAIPVEIVPVQKQDVKVTTTQPMSAEAFHSANMGVRVTGYVEAVFVDIGTRVKAGQPLLKISVPEQVAKVDVLRSEIAQRIAAIAAARAEQRAMESEYQRTQALVEKGSVTEKAAAEARHQLERATAAVAAAEAARGVSEARLGEAEQMLAYATLTAPFEGIVAARAVNPGDLVIADSPVTLLQVVTDKRLRMVTYIPERDAVLLDNGDPAILSFDAYPGQTFPGVVSRTTGVLDKQTRRMRAEIDVDNSKGVLYPGMYGRIVIELTSRPDAMVLPAGAIRLNDGPAHVYTVVDSEILRVLVELGYDNGTQVEILAGLTGSERVVANRIGRLRDGDRVTVHTRN